MPSPWRRWLRHRLWIARPAPARRAARPAPAARVRLETLEGRAVPAVYYVTTTADVVDPADGLLSLREAVLAANASAGVADTIVLPAGTYTLTRTGADEDAAATGDLDLWDDLTIQGAGAAATVVDGNFTDRVFDVQAGSVTIAGLTVRNGSVLSGVAGSPDEQGGGGLAVAPAGPGGSIPGALSLSFTLVSNNRAEGGSGTGAGQSSGTGGAADGGGVQVTTAGSHLVSNSTVSANQAAGGPGGGGLSGFGGAASGGGLAFASSGTVSNSTISGNRAAGGAATTTGTGAGGRGGDARGGGLVAGSALVTNSTVTRNAAAAGTGNRASGTGLGGGFASPAAGGAGTAFRSTILAGNAATTTSADAYRPVTPVATSQGSNLVGDGTGAPGFADGVNGDQVGTAAAPIDPRLGPLADNGGRTPTHALLADSPAINRGSNAVGLATDQRGPGFPRVSGPTADVGAFEATYTLPWASGSFADVTTLGGTAYQFTVTYRDDVGIHISSLGTGDVRVTGPGGFSVLAQFVSVDFGNDGTPRNAVYRFMPPGGSWDAADNGTYTVSVVAGEVTDTSGNAVPSGRSAPSR
jgi:CSLREA domain-containing protein